MGTAESAGLEGVTPYTLRHFGVSWALAGGIPTADVEVPRDERDDARNDLPSPARDERRRREAALDAFAERSSQEVATQ